MLERARIAFGLGIVENGYDETAKVEAFLPPDMERGERALLLEAKAWMAHLPFDSIDLLIIDEMGKDISGAGMDSNIIGRHGTFFEPPYTHPKVTFIVVCDLTPHTYGNAIGIGSADFTTRRLADKIDWEATYVNGLTAVSPSGCKLPAVLDSAAVNITDNAVGSPQKVTLIGVGTIAKLSPLSLSFGSVVIDTTSPSQTVTLTNVGTTTLSIIGIGITGTNAGNFAQTHTCGTSLVAGASCSISVTFKPTALGTRTATLNISDNGGGSPQRVSLSGTGVAGRCSPRGTQCAPQFPPCCPGLKCTFLGNRAFCEP